MSTAKSRVLTRPEIRKILRSHRGAMVDLARRLGIKPVNVSKWLKGQTVSDRVAEAAQAKALELLRAGD